MILARPVSLERDGDLASAWARLGVRALTAPFAHRTVLVTGLDEGNAQALTQACAWAAQGLSGAGGSLVAGIQHLAGAGGRGDVALVSTTRHGLEVVAGRLRARGFGALATALEQVERAGTPPAATRIGQKTFAWGTRTFVMGVLNVTPDSFSDGGQHATVEAAVRHALDMADAGVDLIDVGGESTRPGAEAVPLDEERRRVLPVVEALEERLASIPVSVDTSKAALAKEALAAGAALINDVTGLTDAALLDAVAKAGAACCAMHMQGAPRTMQEAPKYGDVVAEVLEALSGAVERATAAGVPREQVLVDPGIGFGKTFGHNLFLLRHLEELRVLGLPLLVGTSRKAFLGHLVGEKPAGERVLASAASAAVLAVLNGADVVRVHDVAETRQALAVADAVRAAAEGGAAFVRSPDGAPSV